MPNFSFCFRVSNRILLELRFWRQRQVGGAVYFFTLIHCLIIETCLWISGMTQEELREKEASEFSLVAWHIYKVRVDNLTVSSGLKPEETQRKNQSLQRLQERKKCNRLGCPLLPLRFSSPQHIKQTGVQPQREWSCQSIQKHIRKEEQLASNIQV